MKIAELGYILELKNLSNGVLFFEVRTPSGYFIASVGFEHLKYGNDCLIVSNKGGDEYEPFTEPLSRRKGIMTELYHLAERLTGKTVIPYDYQANAHEKFVSQKNHEFGPKKL